MFAARYFPGRYFPRRYFPAVGSGVTTVAITAGEVTITGIAAIIYTATLAAKLRLITNDNEAVYIGPSTVTPANGFPLPPDGYTKNGDYTFDVPASTALYGICSTGKTTKVRYIGSE